VELGSEIRALSEADAGNFRVVYASVGAAAILPDDVAGLYKMHYSAIQHRLPDLPAQIAGALYVACRKHLVMGATALFRCYSTQAFRETRTAVEAAGIARAIRADPENFSIFKDDKGSGASRKAARARFTSKLLFPSDVPEFTRLGECYKKASELSHTNRRTLVPNLDLNEQLFSYQDIRQKDIPRLVVNHLLWICFAHITILEAADLVFNDVSGDLESFRNECRYVGERLARFDEKNQGTIVG
jgi:hypothetical protein